MTRSLRYMKNAPHFKPLCEPKTGVIIGKHIVGPKASELIHELITTMYYEGTVRDILRMPHYHQPLLRSCPTLLKSLSNNFHRSNTKLRFS